MHGVRGKQSFSSIYDEPDPTAYFTTLTELQYRRSDFVWEWVHRPENNRLLDTNSRRTVVDVGCSYGINALVLKWGIPFRASAELYDLVDNHPGLFTSLAQRGSHIRVIGVDTAVSAMDFAIREGLIDASITTDVNVDPLTASEQRQLRAGVDYMFASGVFSYVRAAGFGRLLDATTRRADFTFVGWPLYGDDVDDVEAVCADRNLAVIHSVDRLLPQRLYASADEQDTYRRRITDRGLPFDDTIAEEYLCATEFVASEKGVS